MNDYIRNLETGPEVIVAVMDPEGRIVYISETIKTLAGYEPAQMIGMYGLEFLHFEDAVEGTQKLFAVSLEHGAEDDVTVRLKNAWGGWDPYDVHLENRTEDPEIKGMVVVHRPSAGTGLPR
jgi:PAS domain S-box-containing protein